MIVLVVATLISLLANVVLPPEDGTRSLNFP